MRSIHYAANILDPNFNGKNLTLEQQLKGMKFIQDRIGFLYVKSPKFPTQLSVLMLGGNHFSRKHHLVLLLVVF